MRRLLTGVLLVLSFGLGLWLGLRTSRPDIPRPEKAASPEFRVAPAASAPPAQPGEARVVVKQRGRLSGGGHQTAAVPATEPGPASSMTMARAAAPKTEGPAPAPSPAPSPPEEPRWQGPLEGRMEVELRTPAGERLDTTTLPLQGEFQAVLDEAGRLSLEGEFAIGQAAIIVRPAVLPPRAVLTLELTTGGLGGEIRYNFLRREHLALGVFLRHQAGETVGGIGLTLAF